MVNGDGVVGRGQRGQITRTNPGLDGCFYKARNRAEFDLAGNECGDRDLVRGIEYGGCAAPGAQRLIGQPQCGKTLEIGRLKGELAYLGEIESG